MDAILVAFGVILLAELGDKSQLLALTLASRGRPLAVLAGIAGAAAVLQALAVSAGAIVREALPERPVELVAGAAFVGFALVTALRRDPDPEEVRVAARPGAVALTAAAAFFVAELGDKTQLATLTLATTNGAIGTWLGAVAGIVAADAVAVALGARLGRRLRARPLRRVSAAAFAVFGVLLFAGVG